MNIKSNLVNFIFKHILSTPKLQLMTCKSVYDKVWTQKLFVSYKFPHNIHTCNHFHSNSIVLQRDAKIEDIKNYQR